MVLGQIDQLLVHDIAHKADAVVRIVVIDVAIDLVLVDVLGEQLADDEEYLRTGAIEGEATRIGHHAAIDGNGKGFAKFGKTTQLPHHAEHQLAGAGGLRLRDDEVGINIGLQVMVDEYLAGRTGHQRRLHILDTTGRIEVETDNEVGYLEQHVTLAGMLVVAHYLLAVRQPVQEVGILVGHDNGNILATLTKKLSHAQRRTDSIAIGTLMANHQNGLSSRNQLVHLGQLIGSHDIYIHLKKLVGVNSLVDQLLDAVNGVLTIGSIGHTEPLGGRVEHFAGSGAFGDELVDHQGDKELGLQVLHVLGVREELLEIFLAVLEIVGGEAPYVHGNGGILVESLPLALLVLELDDTIHAQNLSALNHIGKVAIVVVRAYATSHRTVLAEGVTYAETYHGILVLGSLGQRAQELANLHEAVATVEVVAVDDAERLLDNVLTHEHSMIGAPRLLTTLGNRESCGQCVECLETELTLHLALVLRENLGAELLFEILADNPYYLTKTCLNGVVDTIIHDGLAIGAQTVELLQATIAATHTSS